MTSFASSEIRIGLFARGGGGGSGYETTSRSGTDAVLDLSIWNADVMI